jgi:hypothetical protein
MTTSSYKICKALGLTYYEFNLEKVRPTSDATTKIGGSEKGRNKGYTGGATITGRRFITNGVIEKIIADDTYIPDGFYYGRIRSTNPKKSITINGITYDSNKEAARALNITPGMVTYLRNRDGDNVIWNPYTWKTKVGA